MTKPFEIGQDGLLKTALDDPVVLSGGSWDELRLFLAVAKLGSFARAGDYLGLSTATIARQVKRLQDRLRTQLIVPGRTGSRLTEDGAALAKALADLDHKLFSIASNLRADNKHPEAVVRVSATEGLGGIFLASKLADFHELWPGISVHLKAPINLTSLRDNRADLMIGFEPVQASDVSSRPLGYLHLVPIASEAYLRKNGFPDEDSLQRHHFVDSHFYHAETGMWAEWHRVIRKGQVAASCDSSFAYASAILGGLGIGLLGNYTLSEKSLRHAGLGIHVRVPLFVFGLVERVEARPVQVVMQWLVQTFGADNPWFGPDLTLRGEGSDEFRTVMGALLGETTGIER